MLSDFGNFCISVTGNQFRLESDPETVKSKSSPSPIKLHNSKSESNSLIAVCIPVAKNQYNVMSVCRPLFTDEEHAALQATVSNIK